MPETNKYKRPNLSHFKNCEGLPSPTGPEELIADKYTRIRFCVVEGVPDVHTAWLVVDNQYIKITAGYADTANAASWHCWMLAKAILKIIKQEEKVED